VRIVWLTHQYPPDHLGGVELYTHALARRAQADGHDVAVVTYTDHPSLDLADWGAVERSHDGVRVLDVGHNLWPAPNIALWEYDNPLVSSQVEAILEELRPDVVHCTHAMKLSAGVLEACYGLGIPVLVSLSDFWFLCARHTLLRSDGAVCEGPADTDACFTCTQAIHGFDDGPRERAAVQARADHLRSVVLRADRILSFSRFLHDTFVRNGYPPERLVYMPHGLEATGLERAPVPGHRARFVLAGNLVEHKGQHVALAALRARPDLDVELVVHGPLREGEPYGERLIAEAARDPRVRLAGAYAPDDLGAILAAADCLLMPALWYENNPNIVKAALHVGLPVMVSDLGSLPEMLRDGVDGWVLPAGDVEAWAAGIEAAAAVVRERPRAPRPQLTMDEDYPRMIALYEELASSAMIVRSSGT
jgi:glycosyltransferase involved in cell wall biosynthesis